MTDMICKKSMARCQTPGMCSPHGGCNTSDAQWFQVARDLAAERDQLKAENEALRKAAEWVIQIHRDPNLSHEIPNEEWLDDLESAMSKGEQA
ncbi:hypothetical protein [Pseudomonas chlororaphis]|uniref:hypothetical protein n=1 Tax=Pseudomonas chlororaphis TaxID=587753 RepID=UPI0015DF9DDC|nr:hypothetical protein [Pseudomonas chlororaphis]QLL11723.1 hypothetical protein H0I86_22220 [Pseudomonas chlororaphis subsp. aurantiaca]